MYKRQVQGLVQDPRDNFDSFERDAEALVKDIEANGREADVRMRATVSDFDDVMNDPSIATVVVRGFGNLSTICTPVGPGDHAPYTNLEWLHLSRMASHLKLGRFVVRSCGG